MNTSGATSSTRPYLIRAIHEWCADNGLTPYVAVQVDDSVRVPREYVKGGEIVLNISMDATSALKLGNEYIEFRARFAGVARDIMIPVNRVMAIYARESGQGMAFPLEEDRSDSDASSADAAGTTTSVVSDFRATADGPGTASDAGREPGNEQPDPPKSGGGAGRPALKRVK